MVDVCRRRGCGLQMGRATKGGDQMPRRQAQMTRTGPVLLELSDALRLRALRRLRTTTRLPLLHCVMCGAERVPMMGGKYCGACGAPKIGA